MAKNKQQRLYLVTALTVVLCVSVVAGILLLTPASEALEGLQKISTHEGSDSTPYGEELEIELNTGAETSPQASWLASYSDSSNQNVYTVDGAYKSQEQVTLGYGVSISHANVENIRIVDLYIKAVDTADSSSYTYTLASNKPLSGASPISDSDNVIKTITQHLNDIEASTTSATVSYSIYAKVQATGAISGLTLTAEIPETQFAELSFQRSSESTSANVTPSIGVASWAGEVLSTGLVAVGVIMLILLVYFGTQKSRARKRR